MQSPPVISIVDDDDSVRSATTCLVRSLGYSAQSFSSAEEFLQSPLVNDTACLIVDVQMPRMNGLVLQGLLRARGLDTPIIFITAFPEKRVEARALEGGALCLLPKPFDTQVLIECLQKAVKLAE